MARELALLVCLVACGGTTTVDDGGVDATTDVVSDASFADVVKNDVVDASTFDGCVPDLPSGYAAQWIPPNPPQSKCTAGQIQSLYDACVGPNQNASACNAFNNANAACVACMETPLGSSTYGPTIEWHSGGALQINTAGCMALVDGDSSDAGCGAKYGAYENCFIAACSGCPGGTFESCALPAQQSVCAAFASAANTCAAESKYASCIATTTFEQAFATLGALFCSGD